MFRFICFVAFAFAGFVPRACLGQESAEGVLQRAMDAYQSGRVDDAFELANRAIGMAPADPTGYFIRGTVHETRQKYVEALADLNTVVGSSPNLALAYSRRGGLHFKLGDFDASAADFDKEIELAPSKSNNHWQRGISLYYAGRFEDGWKQFELSYKTANPDDYENGIFHFLCVAKARGMEKARKSMLKIGGDKRVPMKEIYDLYRGTGNVEVVMSAAEAGYPNAVELNDRLFYAHLYVGLYLEAAGDVEAARKHIVRAVENFQIFHYMWDVARIQRQRLAVDNESN